MTSATRPAASPTTPGCDAQHLGQLRAHPQRRVERRRRVLRHVADPGPARFPQLGRAERQQVGPVEADLPGDDPQARRARGRAGRAPRSSCPSRTRRSGRVPRPAAHREGDLADHVGTGLADPHRQVGHLKPGGAGRRGRAGQRGPRRWPGRISFGHRRAEVGNDRGFLRPAVGADRHPGDGIGEGVRPDGQQRDQRGRDTITDHGFSASPTRFSLIIVPQLAAGGGWPKPRKASPAMMTIE